MKKASYNIESLLSQKQIIFLHALLFAITAAIIFNTQILVFTDYLNYLARVEIYNKLHDDEIMSEFYYQDMKLTPYLAFFTIVSKLEPLVGIYTAGKIYVVFSMLLILLGGLFLNKTLNEKFTVPSLFIHIFMFNFALSMGFMNFYLGIGLVLIGIALWIKNENKTGSGKTAFYLMFALYGLLVFFCHIFSLFILGVFIGSYEIFSRKISCIKGFGLLAAKSAAKVLSFTAIPMAITPLIAMVDMGFPPLTFGVGFSYILQDILASPANFHSNILAFITVMLLLSLILTRVLVSKKFALPLIFLATLSLFIPFMFVGVAFVNTRIPIAISLIFVCSACCTNNIGRARKMLFIAFLIAGMISYVSSLASINKCDAVASEMAESLKADKTLAGKKLLTVIDDGKLECGNIHAHKHLASLLAIETKVFIPELITGIPPLGVNDKYAAIDGRMSNSISPAKLKLSRDEAYKLEEATRERDNYDWNLYWKNWRRDFDYVNWLHFDKKPTEVPNNLEIYKEGRYFTIYRNTNIKSD